MVNLLYGMMMPSYLKQILHTQFFSVLNILFGFGTLYVLIKYMPVVEYGEYVLIQGFIALSGLVLSQNIYSYARLHIPGAEKNVQYGYLKTVISIVFLGYFSIFVFSYSFNFEQNIWNFFEISLDYSYLILFMLGLELINLEFMRFFIALKKIYLKNYAQFFQKVFVLVSILLLLYFNLLTLTNFLYTYIVGQVLVFFSFVYSLDVKQLIVSPFISDVVKKGYHVAIPLLPIGLMSIALNYTDTLMIAKYVSKTDVAQYGFASQIVSIAMMMIGSSIVLTLFPYATEAHNKNEMNFRNVYFLKMLKYGVLLALLFYIIIYFGAESFIGLLGLEQYAQVPQYLYILAIFPLFQLIYSVSSHHLQLLKVFNIQIYISFIIIAFNVIINYFLIEKYGSMGAAYASIFSYILLSMLYISISLHAQKKESLSNTH